MKHGALGDGECIGEDMKGKGMRVYFPSIAKS